MYKIMCNFGLLLFAQVTPFPCSSIPKAGVTWEKIIFLSVISRALTVLWTKASRRILQEGLIRHGNASYSAVVLYVKFIITSYELTFLSCLVCFCQRNSRLFNFISYECSFFFIRKFSYLIKHFLGLTYLVSNKERVATSSVLSSFLKKNMIT